MESWRDLRPGYLDLVFIKAAMYLEEGDLGRARAVLKAVPREVDPVALVVFIASTGNEWLLDVEQRDLLMRLTPTAFNDDRAVWGLSLARIYALNGDAVGAHHYAEEARTALDQQLLATPAIARLHAQRGFALALLGTIRRRFARANALSRCSPSRRTQRWPL